MSDKRFKKAQNGTLQALCQTVSKKFGHSQRRGNLLVVPIERGRWLGKFAGKLYRWDHSRDRQAPAKPRPAPAAPRAVGARLRAVPRRLQGGRASGGRFARSGRGGLLLGPRPLRGGTRRGFRGRIRREELPR